MKDITQHQGPVKVEVQVAYDIVFYADNLLVAKKVLNSMSIKAIKPEVKYTCIDEIPEHVKKNQDENVKGVK